MTQYRTAEQKSKLQRLVGQFFSEAHTYSGRSRLFTAGMLDIAHRIDRATVGDRRIFTTLDQAQTEQFVQGQSYALRELALLAEPQEHTSPLQPGVDSFDSPRGG